MVELKGVIPAITTPFKEDQSLDLDAYRRLVDLVISEGVNGIVPAGCTGESWSLSDDERAQVFRTAVEQAAGRVVVVPGCGAITSKEAITKVRQAEKAGCDAVMVQPPWYVLLGLDEVYAYYKEILAATELPIMVYNIPRRTGISMTPDFVDRLADEPKVIAVKESSKDWLVLSEIIRRCKDRVTILVGYAALLGIAGFAEGAVGFVDSITPVVGRMTVDFYKAMVSGDTDEARRLEGLLRKANNGFFGIGTFPAANKAAMNMLGRPGGRTRDPIKALNAEQLAKVRDVLVSVGLLADEKRRRATA